MRLLPGAGHVPVGIDVRPGPTVDAVGSITESSFVDGAMRGAGAVLHTATLHKPHVATHDRQAFVDVNVTGTLTLLEAAVRAGVRRFVFTSTTSAFGAALTPEPCAPAAWIDESVRPVPKNIYGASKVAAEDLCELFARTETLTCVVLRTSRFFPEPDDSAETRAGYADANAKANEFLFRRVDIEDVATAHLCALEAPAAGFARYVVSATTPFRREDAAALRTDAPAVVAQHVRGFEAVYARRGFRMFPSIGRVYDNAAARAALGWRPRYDFARILDQIARDEPIGSGLARTIGIKGYHGDPAWIPWLEG